MGSWKGRRRTIVALAGASLLACSARAAEAAAFVSPSTADRLSPGTILFVSWTAGQPSATERDEMELVLSFDDGATFPVRVTGPVDMEAHSALVRVPALPSEHVRIALRAGDDEEAGSEEILFVSEPFSIESPGGPTPDALFPVANEWRTSDALEGAPVRSRDRGIQTGDPAGSLTPFEGDTAAVETGLSICPIPYSETHRTGGGDTPRRPRRLAKTLPAARAAVPLRL